MQTKHRPISSSLLVRLCTAWMVSIALVMLASVAIAAPAPSNGMEKLSSDLRAALGASKVDGIAWARDTAGGRMVKVLVLADPAVDPELKDLRRDIVKAGGSVYYRYISVSGVLALLPASKLVAIAARSDVESISPNRITSRTRSLVERATGAAQIRGTAGGAGINGASIGIAILDSGIMASHQAFAGPGGSRVKRSVDFTRLDRAEGLGLNGWVVGLDHGEALRPGSVAMAALESTLDSRTAAFQDPHGHGTLVASIAAGSGVAGGVDATGIAPGASLFDVRVLNDQGIGDVAHALAGIDWVIQHGKELGIRVLNVSLAADSTDSYLRDPLCRAVRNAVAAGINVVVAAGNFGLQDGKERYGSISSPGNEPSAITVGSANPHASPERGDDTVNRFSSRGPTRGGYFDALGVRRIDNVLKPDLVAPGNRLVGAMSANRVDGTLNMIARTFPELRILPVGPTGAGLMTASGTSFSAPAVAGAVALLLQKNPGLTPGLVKAILQYTAEPLPGHNLLQQGTGLVNVAGAMDLAGALATDIATRVASGRINTGDSMLAPGKSMPAPATVIEGRTAAWSRFVFLGGRHVFAGEKLFTAYQGAYDPAVEWVGTTATTVDVEYFNGLDRAYITGFEQDKKPKKQLLVSAGVVTLTSFLGNGNAVFTPNPAITSAIAAQVGIVLPFGIVLAEGIVLGEGMVLGEGIVLGESIVLAEGIVLGEGIVLDEGIILGEGIVLNEGPLFDLWSCILGEP